MIEIELQEVYWQIYSGVGFDLSDSIHGSEWPGIAQQFLAQLMGWTE